MNIKYVLQIIDEDKITWVPEAGDGVIFTGEFFSEETMLEKLSQVDKAIKEYQQEHCTADPSCQCEDCKEITANSFPKS